MEIDRALFDSVRTMMPRECKRLTEVDLRVAAEALTRPMRVREDAGASGDLPP